MPGFASSASTTPRSAVSICPASKGSASLSAARAALGETEPFDAEHVESALRGVVDQLDAKPGKVFQPVRVAIAGQTVSPGIFESVALLGKEETLARIDSALARARDDED